MSSGFSCEIMQQKLSTRQLIHSQSTRFFFFFFPKIIFPEPLSVPNSVSIRVQTEAKPVREVGRGVCVCRGGLYKCGSWLSRLCRPVDNIPDSGARCPQGRQAGQIWSRLKPTRTSWHLPRTWHPEEARALHHGAKHTLGLRNFITDLNTHLAQKLHHGTEHTHLAQVLILQLNPHSGPRNKSSWHGIQGNTAIAGLAAASHQQGQSAVQQ